MQYLMRQYVYRCPACRVWAECLSTEIRELCHKRGACVECVRTDFFRLRCHVARIEASIMDPDEMSGGIIACKARQQPPNERELYRRLWRKRERQLAAARTMLENVRGSRIANTLRDTVDVPKQPPLHKRPWKVEASAR